MIEIRYLLQEIIRRDGVGALSRHPKKLYNRLLLAEIEPREAAAVAVTLLAGIPGMIATDPSLNSEQVAALISDRCALVPEMSQQLAQMYRELLTENEVRDSFDLNSGFYAFCRKNWSVEAVGIYRWFEPTVAEEQSCMVTAQIEFAVRDLQKSKDSLAALLELDPYVKGKKIVEFYKTEFSGILEEKLSGYVRSEIQSHGFELLDPENYPFEELIVKLCTERGLSLVDLELDIDCSW